MSLRNGWLRFWDAVSVDTKPKFTSPIWMTGICFAARGQSADRCKRRAGIEQFLPAACGIAWMTYREGMEALRPSRMTSDAGWGCMLRSGQMLLCNALVNRTLGTEWRLAVRLGAEEQSHTATRTAGVLDACPDPVALRRVLSLFADCPDAPFGIHAVSEHALAHRGMHPGDWYTPGAISTTLAEMLCAAMPFGVRGYCADGATVARDRVAEELGAQGCTGLLVFVPLRLSPARIDPSYEGQIAELFHYPQFVGIVGGRPRSSLYFFASQDTCLYYLNPHYVHDADTLECPDSLDSLDTHFTNRVRRMQILDMDPSMSLGFIFSDMADFESFVSAYTNVDKSIRMYRPFYIADSHL